MAMRYYLSNGFFFEKDNYYEWVLFDADGKVFLHTEEGIPNSFYLEDVKRIVGCEEES